MKKTSKLVKFGVDTTFDTVFFLICIALFILGGAGLIKLGLMFFGEESVTPEMTKWMIIISCIIGGILGFMRSPPTK